MGHMDVFFFCSLYHHWGAPETDIFNTGTQLLLFLVNYVTDLDSVSILARYGKERKGDELIIFVLLF